MVQANNDDTPALSIWKTLLAHTDDVVSKLDGDEYGDINVDLVVDPFSESEQAMNQSTLRKPAQPHKLKKIKPKFGNFETV